MGRGFDCSRSTGGLEQGLSGCSRAYNGVVLKMFDYSKPSNEIDSLKGFGTKCTPETS